MSIEAALAELTAEVKSLREVTTNLLNLRADAIETVKNAAAPKTTKKAEKPVETPAAAEPTPEPEATKPQPAASTGDEPLSDVQVAIGSYVGADGISAEERDARKAKALSILKKVGAEKATDVPADKAPAVVKAMKTLLEQGNLIKVEEADDDLLG